MAKKKGITLIGMADGISFNEALKDAIKQTPPIEVVDVMHQYKLIEFSVKKGGIIGQTTSYIKVQYTNDANAYMTNWLLGLLFSR